MRFFFGFAVNTHDYTHGYVSFEGQPPQRVLTPGLFWQWTHQRKINNMEHKTSKQLGPKML